MNRHFDSAPFSSLFSSLYSVMSETNFLQNSSGPIIRSALPLTSFRSNLDLFFCLPYSLRTPSNWTPSLNSAPRDHGCFPFYFILICKDSGCETFNVPSPSPLDLQRHFCRFVPFIPPFSAFWHPLSLRSGSSPTPSNSTFSFSLGVVPVFPMQRKLARVQVASLEWKKSGNF